MDDCSDYSTFVWDVESAFKNVGAVYDALVDPTSEGDWDGMLNGMSRDMDLDLRDMVSRLTIVFRLCPPQSDPSMSAASELRSG